MSNSKLIRPTYAESFRCIGADCEDTCCQGWSVPIDQVTYEKYQDFPAGPLRTLIDASILRAPESALSSDGFGPGLFAKIQMTASNQCPLLSADHLCRIQQEGGEALLPHSCGTYPRIVSSIGGVEEKALALSCPEAARLVLLQPALLGKVGNRGANVKEIDDGERSNPIQSWFLDIRTTALELIQNRAYPLWQRLFLLGVFCRRLDAIVAGELKQSVPGFLIEFQATVAAGTLRGGMETLPTDGEAQMDVVLRLAGLMLYLSNVGRRFGECIHAFTTRIGNRPDATLRSLTAQYSLAHDRYFAPFFARHPHILENYVINTIFRCQFPFGRDGMRKGASPSMMSEFAMLTAQITLIRGLMIGVAGFHRERFSTEHIVHTVQAASKHFDHHPEFLGRAHALLVESRMDGARGLAILLRNPGPSAAVPVTSAIHVPEPVIGTTAA